MLHYRFTTRPYIYIYIFFFGLATNALNVRNNKWGTTLYCAIDMYSVRVCISLNVRFMTVGESYNSTVVVEITYDLG